MRFTQMQMQSKIGRSLELVAVKKAQQAASSREQGAGSREHFASLRVHSPDMKEEEVPGRWSRGGGAYSGGCEDCSRDRVERECASKGSDGSRDCPLSLDGLT